MSEIKKPSDFEQPEHTEVVRNRDEQTLVARESSERTEFVRSVGVAKKFADAGFEITPKVLQDMLVVSGAYTKTGELSDVAVDQLIDTLRQRKRMAEEAGLKRIFSPRWRQDASGKERPFSSIKEIEQFLGQMNFYTDHPTGFLVQTTSVIPERIPVDGSMKLLTVTYYLDTQNPKFQVVQHPIGIQALE